MFNWLKLPAQLGIVVIGLSACLCLAAGNRMSTTAGDDSHEQSWNREQKSSTKLDARAIIQQKAEVRAEQRGARLAASSWYGITNSRPSGTATPFTARYGSVWEMPGGRPYSWYPPNTQ